MAVEVTRCAHLESEVVVPIGADRVVARICSSCLDPLPAEWGCQECEWEEILEFGGRRFIISTLLCVDHRYLEGL